MLTEINLGGTVLRIVVFSKDTYADFRRSLYHRPEFIREFTVARLFGAKRATEDRIRTSLQARWVEVEDFEVGADGNEAFTLCGGVYSRRIMCRDYLSIIHRHLRCVTPHLWCYATAVEAEGEAGERVPHGTFILRGNDIVVREGTDLLTLEMFVQ